MPRGAKPKPPGEASHRNAVAHPWKPAPGKGWQHGRRPAPPRALKTEAGKRAWKTWLSSWWAAFYDPADLPGLEATAIQFELHLIGLVDISKVTPLLDRYGITPKGRQDLRWVRPEPEEKGAAERQAAENDELAKRREELRARGVG